MLVRRMDLIHMEGGNRINLIHIEGAKINMKAKESMCRRKVLNTLKIMMNMSSNIINRRKWIHVANPHNWGKCLLVELRELS